VEEPKGHFEIKTLALVGILSKMRKLQPFKVEGVNKLKKKPQNITKVDFRTPKKFFVCSYIVIRIST